MKNKEKQNIDKTDDSKNIHIPLPDIEMMREDEYEDGLLSNLEDDSN